MLRFIKRLGRRESDFAEEIRSHIALEADRLVADGWAPRDAELEARRRFGNVGASTERYHDARRITWLDDLWRDLRFALRSLRRERVYAGLAIVALAIGIGANTAFFTLYDSIALRPLPVPQPERMANLWRTTRDVPFPQPFSFAEYAFYRDNARGASIAAASPAHLRITGSGTAPQSASSGSVFGFAGPRALQGIAEPVLGLFVSGNYFDVWRVHPVIGRAFTPADDRQAGPPWPVLLSENYWRRRFGGDPAVLDRPLVVDGLQVRVVGVTPADFKGERPQVPDLWMPMASRGPEAERIADPNQLCCEVDARLADGTTIDQLRAELATLQVAARRAYPTLDGHATLHVAKAEPLGAALHANLGMVYLVFQPAIALILLIACANVAGLLLGRAAARQREIAVRLALGAGRGRLVRQLVTEAVAVATIAAVLGLAMSTWMLGAANRVLQASLGGSGLSDGGTFVITAAPDWRVFAYAMIVAMVTGILFGLAPALQSTRPDLTASLKDDGRIFGAGSRSRLRNVLVATQVAVSLTLLLVAAMLVRGGERLLRLDPGFEVNHVIDLGIEDPGVIGYAPAHVDALARTLRERIPALGTVRSVAEASRVPLAGNVMATIVTKAGATLDSAQADAQPRWPYTLVDSAYFATMGIALERGRGFTRHESKSGAPVAVVSAGLARRLWPDEDPVGKRIDVGRAGGAPVFGQGELHLTSVEVIGVARDTYGTSPLAADPGALYLPFPSEGWPSTLLVRAKGSPTATVADLARELRAIDSRLSVSAQTMEGVLSTQATYVTLRIVGVLLAAIGVLGLVMATVGVYSMVGYAVSRQTREVGIRLALGARPRDAVRLVLARTLAPVWAGLAVGLVCGAAAAYTASTMLAGLRVLDPLAMLVITAVLAFAALTAATVPAMRVAGVDPLLALRVE